MTVLAALGTLSDEQIQAASRASGEPAWMTESRLAAWQHFASSEPPYWRRTDLSKLNAASIDVPVGTKASQLLENTAGAEQGVIFTTLAQALRDYEQLVRQYFGTAIDGTAHKFSALRSALWQDGIFLYVPKNVSVEVPFHVQFGLPEGSNASFVHNIIVLERGASASFIEEYSSPDQSSQALSGPTTEIFLGEGSSLKYAPIQNWGAGVYHLAAQRVIVGRDANLEWVTLNLGAQVQHLECETALQGDGSQVNWVAATLAGGTQSLLSAPWLRHMATNTEGHMDFKTVVKDTGYSTFDGMIKIDHESRGTISRLEEHALHLSPKARNDSIPGLMIDTNDVAQAGHASTSGQIEEEQLFYMLTRGIPRAEAIHMIVMGFFEPIIDRLPSEELRHRMAAQIEARI